MKLYHLTYREAGAAIQRGGFGRAERYVGTRVFFASTPEDIARAGVPGDTWLTLDVPDHQLDELAPYALRPSGWLMPAELADRYGPPRIIDAPT